MNRDAYALHRTPTLDTQYAYCLKARETLARLHAAKRVTVWGRIKSIFGF